MTGTFLKILFGLCIAVAVLAATFYAWMWWAWTPKAPSGSAYLRGTVKKENIAQNLIHGGVFYEIGWEAPPEDPSKKEHRLFVWRPGKEESRSNILYVEGKPVPQTVKITRRGFIEVYFDGHLQNGGEGLNIEVDDDFYRDGYISVINGVVQP